MGENQYNDMNGERNDIFELTEGAGAFYTEAKPNENDVFVITVGGYPLMAGRGYSHRGDAGYKGLFSCEFDPAWDSCVATAMLWRFIPSDGGFYIRNVGCGAYLTASADTDADKYSLDLGSGSCFYFTNEGWLAFYADNKSECYLIYSQHRGFICPSPWTSSMTQQSDVTVYAVTPSDSSGTCRVYINKPDESNAAVMTYKAANATEKTPVTIESGAVLSRGDTVAVFAGDGGYIDRTVRYNGVCLDFGAPYRIYRDTVIEITGAPRHSKTTYLSFISDVHNLPGRLKTWASSLPEEVCLERMIFGGDITAGNVKSIAAQQAAHKRIAAVVAAYSIYPPVITIGNHELEYEYRWGGRKPEEIYPDSVQYGGFIYERYAVYNFGAGEFDYEDFQSNFNLGRIEELGTWLHGVPDGIPVFINAHYPLHAIKTRPKPGNAADMINVLNGHKNIVYLWGHNHGQEAEDGYGRILPPGSVMKYNYTDDKKERINFTYCSHGAMYDAARTVSPYYGLVAAITPSSDGEILELTYYDMSGSPVGYKTADGSIGGITYKTDIK